jgi:hypothetical protein
MSENNLYKTFGNDESGAFCRFGEPRLHVGDGRFSLNSRYCHSSGRRVKLLEVQCSAILALLLGNKVSLAAVISVIHRTSNTCISQRIRSPSQLKILAQDTTTYEGEKKFILALVGNLKETEHLEDLGIDRIIILKCILNTIPGVTKPWPASHMWLFDI